MARSARPADLGMLATRLLFGLQSELFRRSAEAGFGDLRPRHGAVVAHLDEDGLRQNDFVRLAGRNKQTIATMIDELEALGYVERVPDPADRRAKLIMPTERGRRLMELSDRVVADIEAEYAATVGRDAYEQFLGTLKKITTKRLPPR
ncbi:MarR family winged helix-turn-helix transcriptional regulator [Paractinoplanes atraurantiacus]|uniref:DNA-binding transcriptional regulator, MarR family n=1 Tax=Paractinoplanes atraurantiacus TaxID=1036182 RepID=A0A285ID31_9ACTN|nr:MarR family winged helix-turn-helix transcriptional regulator [Actinoplanes atraurantiacus]SNY45872.1 DNA-binding transcriptional regulator, MarR family [Actinoplanes atraurantiacus]